MNKRKHVQLFVDPTFRDMMHIEARLADKSLLDYTRDLALMKKKNLLKDIEEASKNNGGGFNFKI